MWNRSLRWGAVLLCGWCFGTGCKKIEAVDITKQVGSFSIEAERLRPDMQPLSSGDNQLLISERTTYSDGLEYDDRGQLVTTGPDTSVPIDPLIFRDIAGNTIQQLRRADCLWVDKGNESARLSYEIILHDLRLEDGTLYPSLGACGSVIHDPRSRGIVSVLNEDEEKAAPGLAQSLFDVTLTQFQGPVRFDRYHACDARDYPIETLTKVVRSLANTPALSSGFADQSGQPDYPACMIEGALGRIDQDTSLRLEIVDTQLGTPLADLGANAPAFDIPTRIKVVEPSQQGNEFLLSRQLTFEGTGAPETEGGLVKTPNLWTWSVEVNRDGSWRENFSPNLRISRIRIFVESDYDTDDDGLSERVYLFPKKVRAFQHYGEANTIREPSCDFDDANGEAVPACENAEGFTPTYHVVRGGDYDQLSDRITWEVAFDDVYERQAVTLPDGSIGFEDVLVQEPPVKPGQKVFIEFNVVRPSTGTSSSGLSVSPPVADVGDFRVTELPTFGNLFDVENFGQGNLQILSVAIEGPDAAAFKLGRLPRMPYTLRPGSQLPLAIEAAPGSPHFGRREARVRIRARDAAGKSASVYGALVGNAVDWIFDTLHPQFTFMAEPRESRSLDNGSNTTDWQKPLIVINDGSAPMPRGRITITGQDATQFSVTRSSSEYLPASDYYPWLNGEQPPAMETIPSGTSETFIVVYHPNSPGLRSLAYGPDEAEIRIRVGDVDYALPVSGWCVGACQYTPPIPVAAPSGGGAVVILPGLAPAPSGGLAQPNESLLIDR